MCFGLYQLVTRSPWIKKNFKAWGRCGAAVKGNILSFLHPLQVTETRTGPLGCNSYDNLDSVSSVLLQSTESKLHLQGRTQDPGRGVETGEGCPFFEPLPLIFLLWFCCVWKFPEASGGFAWGSAGLTPLKCLSALCHWILMDFCVWYIHQHKKNVTSSISIEGEFCPRLSVPPEMLICVRGLQISL